MLPLRTNETKREVSSTSLESHLFTRMDSGNMSIGNFTQGHVTSAIMLQILIPFRAFLAFGTMQLFVKCEKSNLERGVFTPETKEL